VTLPEPNTFVSSMAGLSMDRTHIVGTINGALLLSNASTGTDSTTIDAAGNCAFVRTISGFAVDRYNWDLGSTATKSS
jgi:hypothetical protein